MGFINQQTFHGARGPRGPLAGGVFLAGQDGQALRVEVRVVTGDRAPQRLMVFSNPKKKKHPKIGRESEQGSWSHLGVS